MYVICMYVCMYVYMYKVPIIISYTKRPLDGMFSNIDYNII